MIAYAVSQIETPCQPPNKRTFPFPDLYFRLEELPIKGEIKWEGWTIVRTHVNTFVLRNRWVVIKMTGALHNDVVKWLAGQPVRCDVQIVRRY